MTELRVHYDGLARAAKVLADDEHVYRVTIELEGETTGGDGWHVTRSIRAFRCPKCEAVHVQEHDRAHRFRTNDRIEDEGCEHGPAHS